MKSLSILLAFNLLILAPVAAQTPSVTKPVTKGVSTTTTKSESVAKPASVSSTTTSRSAVRPAATATPAPNRQQELYDQYHGVTKKPSTAAPTPTMPADQPASRPSTAVANTSPAVGRPVSSEGSLSGFRLGVRGGITYLVYLEEVTGIKPAIGFVGGLFANVGKGTFSFQPELNYARYMFNVQNPSGPSDITGAVDQFEIPLLLKISSGSVQTSRFFLNIGPYGAYVSSASINGQKISLSDATNRFRFGAAAGVGAALKTGPGHLTVELRGMYELGDSDTGFTTDSRTVYPQLTIGYLMPLGGR